MLMFRQDMLARILSLFTPAFAERRSCDATYVFHIDLSKSSLHILT